MPEPSFRSTPADPRARDERLEHVREYIQRRLGDGEFNLTEVARAFRLSDRYVRLLFSSSEETPSQFLRHRRLELAAWKLRSRHFGHLTILAIALDCGFNDPAHFSRCFRRWSGVAPRAYRNGAGRQACSAAGMPDQSPPATRSTVAVT